MKQLNLFCVMTLFCVISLTGCASKELTQSGYGVKSDKWIMPKNGDHMPVWGIKNGVIIGIHPSRLSWGESDGGPRGLFRIGYENGGTLKFVNFMAIHPVLERAGRLDSSGSEMAKSPSDGRSGIKFYAYPVDYLRNPDDYDKRPPTYAAAEIIKRNGRQVLTFGIRTEVFPNGARAFIIVRIDEGNRNEIEFECYLTKGQKYAESLVLTSTFGNITRLRKVFLKGNTVFSDELWPNYRGKDFSPMEYFKLSEIPRDHKGDLIFAAAPDEDRPWEVEPYPHNTKFIQYYRKPKGAWESGFKGMVNGRYYFWKSSKKVPGGISYENLAIIEPFEQGQRFFYGIYKGKIRDLLGGD